MTSDRSRTLCACVCMCACMCICEYLCASVCMWESVYVSVCGHVSVCVVYVHGLSSPGLGVQIIGFLIWSKLCAFSGLSFLICKITRSDRMSFRSLHAQTLYVPVKPRYGRREVQIPAALCDFARSQPFLACVSQTLLSDWKLDHYFHLSPIKITDHSIIWGGGKELMVGDTDFFKGGN